MTVENTLFSALRELGRIFGQDRVLNAAGSVLQTAAQTKATVDDNLASVLGFAGIASRSDIEAMRRQLDVVQATLANLSRKLDRVLQEVSQLEDERQSHTTHKGRPRSRTGGDPPAG